MILCQICGNRPASETHHLIYGTSNRKHSDQDGLTVEICRECHNNIHSNSTAGKMSKMIGQLIWENSYLLNNDGEISRKLVTEKFRKIYGRSWL